MCFGNERYQQYINIATCARIMNVVNKNHVLHSGWTGCMITFVQHWCKSTKSLSDMQEYSFNFATAHTYIYTRIYATLQ